MKVRLDLDPARLPFIDETWASTNMARTRGRAPRGQRLRAAVPHGHWKTTTFVAGLRQDGIVAPFVLDGPINRHSFETYVARVLVPDLRPGDIVILDNLSSHKGPKVRQMIEAAGASLRYLPPYSPDFNLIENAFAKLKALLRKAAERTVGALGTGSAPPRRLHAHRVRNYFAAAGYDAVRTDSASAANASDVAVKRLHLDLAARYATRRELAALRRRGESSNLSNMILPPAAESEVKPSTRVLPKPASTAIVCAA